MKIQNQRILNFLLLGIIGMFCTLSAQRKEIIGYFPSWKWKSNSSIMTPEKIPYSKLTMINYAFWYPCIDGTITGRDPIGDSINLSGSNGLLSIVELAHRSKVKVMLSLGGWEDSNNFPSVAADESQRIIFAHSCIEAIRRYGFDGIDIDWEFPGYVEHKGTSKDKKNYTLLLKITKDSLSAYGKSINKKMLLTAALPSSSDALDNFEISDVADLLDMLNIMSYDYNGSWSPVSGHNSPLFAPNMTDTLHNIDATFKYYTQHLKISPDKINLGVPFYGHSFSHCSELNKSHQGQDTALFSFQGAFYNTIVKYVNRSTRHWDDDAKVPYLVLLKENTLISYDDEESVAAKAQYVFDHHAGGVIIWEITGDYFDNGSTPLLDTIYNKFLFLSEGHKEGK